MSSPDSITGVAESLARIDVARADGIDDFFGRSVSVAGHRICNLVLQGGGMLGAAHAGFIYGLERARIRFGGVAGASAGSIVAMALVCARGRDIATPTADILFKLVSSVPTDIFIDGPAPVRRVIKRFLRRDSLVRIGRLGDLSAAIRRTLNLRGLNPGTAFEGWLSSTLSTTFGVRTIVDLNDNLESIHRQLGGLSLLPPDQRPCDVLKLIAASLPVGLKLEFPRDLNLFADRYDRASPALLVRASMSIPVFFDPLEMELKPETWRRQVSALYNVLVEGGSQEEIEALERLYMLDGGSFSNLPIDAFLSWGSPTIAVGLVTNPPAISRLGKPNVLGLAQDALAFVSAIKVQRDRDSFAALSSLDREKIKLWGVRTGDHNWLNFMAGQEDLDDLFARGVSAAADFLSSLGAGEGTNV